MQGGELDQRIVLLTSTPTRQPGGQVVDTPSVLRTVSARVMEGAGKEFVAGGQVAQDEKVAFKIRWASDISGFADKLQVGWEGKRYEVVSSTGTRRLGELWLHCSKIGKYP